MIHTKSTYDSYSRFLTQICRSIINNVTHQLIFPIGLVLVNVVTSSIVASLKGEFEYSLCMICPYALISYEICF